MGNKKALIAAVTVTAAVLLAVLLPPMLATHPPVIAALEVTSDRVFPSESTEIVCTASSPEGEELTYEWAVTGGEILGTGAAIVWTAPASEGIYRVTVTVRDSRGGEDTSHVEVPVWANRPPTITGLTADATWTTPGSDLRITCEAEDPDGDQLSYAWTATAGSINGTGTTIDWTAPAEIGVYDITVIVSDAHGGSDERTLHISVVSGQPPTIESLIVEADHKYLKQTASGYMVGEGESFRIECNASHSDDLELSYEWEYEGGEVSEMSEDGSSITWTAPFTRVKLMVTVTVSDIYDNKISQSVELEVVSCSRFG